MEVWVVDPSEAVPANLNAFESLVTVFKESQGSPMGKLRGLFGWGKKWQSLLPHLFQLALQSSYLTLQPIDFHQQFHLPRHHEVVPNIGRQGKTAEQMALLVGQIEPVGSVEIDH